MRMSLMLMSYTSAWKITVSREKTGCWEWRWCSCGKSPSRARAPAGASWAGEFTLTRPGGLFCASCPSARTTKSRRNLSSSSRNADIRRRWAESVLGSHLGMTSFSVLAVPPPYDTSGWGPGPTIPMLPTWRWLTWPCRWARPEVDTPCLSTMYWVTQVEGWLSPIKSWLWHFIRP